MPKNEQLYMTMYLELNDSWDLEEDFKDVPSKEVTIKVPEGCVGVQLIFDSVDAAIRAYGEGTMVAPVFRSDSSE